MIVIPILWFPCEDKYVTKRKRGVVLYTKPKTERDTPQKEVQFNRQLCTTAYR